MTIYPKISVIILNWNNAKDTLECLDSVNKIDYPDFETIIVDNGSTDDSLSKIKKAYPHIIYLENKENLGFTGGNNIGMSYALKTDAKYFLLLNNDTIVCKHLLNNFIKAAILHPNGGAFGAKIFYYDQPFTLWHAGGSWSNEFMKPYQIDKNLSETQSQKTKVEKIFYAVGAALFLKKEAIEKAGMFDDRFFLVMEDIDLCQKIQKRGYECLFVPEARVWHKVSQSFDGGNAGPQYLYYFHRNRLLFMQKHFSIFQRLKFYPKLLKNEAIPFIRVLLQKSSSQQFKKQIKSIFKGMFHYFISSYGQEKKNHVNSPKD